VTVPNLELSLKKLMKAVHACLGPHVLQSGSVEIRQRGTEMDMDIRMHVSGNLQSSR
jgi:hypothetical protein